MVIKYEDKVFDGRCYNCDAPQEGGILTSVAVFTPKLMSVAVCSTCVALPEYAQHLAGAQWLKA